MKNKLIILALFLFVLQGNNVFAQGCDGGDEPAKENTEVKSETPSVKVFGFIQSTYDTRFLTETENSFNFRRARVGVTGAVAKNVTYYVVLETGPMLSNTGSAYLLDAFMTYHHNDWLKISAGSFKQPFGLETNTACNNLMTIERSYVNDQLVTPQRDMGLMFLGGSDKFKYAVALINGSGLGIKDGNKKKDISSRIEYKPFDFLSVGGSLRYGYPTNNDDDRTTYGLDAELNYNNFKVTGEYIYDEGAFTTVASAGCGAAPETLGPKRQGAYVMASYMTKWNLQPVVKYEFFDSCLDFNNNMSEVITTGINYNLNKSTRIQVNYQYKTESVEIDNDALLVQLQVKF